MYINIKIVIVHGYPGLENVHEYQTCHCVHYPGTERSTLISNLWLCAGIRELENVH